jgi:hypothetical protein
MRPVLGSSSLAPAPTLPCPHSASSILAVHISWHSITPLCSESPYLSIKC